MFPEWLSRRQKRWCYKPGGSSSSSNANATANATSVATANQNQDQNQSQFIDIPSDNPGLAAQAGGQLASMPALTAAPTTAINDTIPVTFQPTAAYTAAPLQGGVAQNVSTPGMSTATSPSGASGISYPMLMSQLGGGTPSIAGGSPIPIQGINTMETSQQSPLADLIQSAGQNNRPMMPASPQMAMAAPPMMPSAPFATAAPSGVPVAGGQPAATATGQSTQPLQQQGGIADQGPTGQEPGAIQPFTPQATKSPEDLAYDEGQAGRLQALDAGARAGSGMNVPQGEPMPDLKSPADIKKYFDTPNPATQGRITELNQMYADSGAQGDREGVIINKLQKQIDDTQKKIDKAEANPYKIRIPSGKGNLWSRGIAGSGLQEQLDYQRDLQYSRGQQVQIAGWRKEIDNTRKELDPHLANQREYYKQSLDSLKAAQQAEVDDVKDKKETLDAMALEPEHLAKTADLQASTKMKQIDLKYEDANKRSLINDRDVNAQAHRTAAGASAAGEAWRETHTHPMTPEERTENRQLRAAGDYLHANQFSNLDKGGPGSKDWDTAQTVVKREMGLPTTASLADIAAAAKKELERRRSANAGSK